MVGISKRRRVYSKDRHSERYFLIRRLKNEINTLCHHLMHFILRKLEDYYDSIQVCDPSNQRVIKQGIVVK